MITLSDYQTALGKDGKHLGEIRKNDSDAIQNATFTGDIAYRRVYILDPEQGWHYEDAKFSRHALVSMSKDGVDSYLEFRPKVHYPIGTYVFIPDDTSYDLEINEENPLYEGAKNLWFIIERNNDRQFVQYLVIKCDWLLRWVVDLGTTKKIAKCWGSAQAANSYTSGIWNDQWSHVFGNCT